MHFGDYTFILLLALVLFGPKKLPEIGRTAGKLLAEFRRASNEFKFQIQEELRNMEEEERRKKLAESKALAATSAQVMAEANMTPEAEAGPTILPPSTGTPVSAARPFATPAGSPEPMELESGLASAAQSGEVQVDPPAPTEMDSSAAKPPEAVNGAVPAHPAESMTHG